jgi:hypothetical protein
MNKTKLTNAVAMALATSALSIGAISSASASTTMYNTWGAGSATPGGVTDGWQYQAGTDDCKNGGPTCGPILPWVGTTNGERPFGITGNSALNWAAHITQPGDTLQISREDAASRYTVEADIDTAGGAWRDASADKTGWAHNTDIGIFKSDVTQDITLKVKAINGPVANFGITVFTLTGTDLGTGYGHHRNWNQATFPIKAPTTSNPFGTTNVRYQVDALGEVMWDDSVGNTDETAFTFRATQDQLYAIYLGGSGGTGWNQQHDRYQLTISSVPVPAAVWLFGSVLAGFPLISRRKMKESI